MMNIDELATAKGMTEEQIMRVLSANDPSIDRTAEHCAGMRQEHRDNRNGFTNDRGRTGRMTSGIPRSVFLHPLFKHYFNVEHDDHEREKHLRAFLCKFPNFLYVDRY